MSTISIDPTPASTMSSDEYRGNFKGSAVGGTGNVIHINNVYYMQDKSHPMAQLKGLPITSSLALTSPNEESVSAITLTSTPVSDSSGQAREDSALPESPGVVSKERKSPELLFLKRRTKSEGSSTETIPIARNPTVVQIGHQPEDYTISREPVRPNPYSSPSSPSACPSYHRDTAEDAGHQPRKSRLKKYFITADTVSGYAETSSAGSSSSGLTSETRHREVANRRLRSGSGSVRLKVQTSALRERHSSVNSHQVSGLRSASPHGVSSSSNRPGGDQKAMANLLEMATRDPYPIITRAHDGSVLAGNLEGLVDGLIWNSDNVHQDADYRDVFLTTYTAFTTADKLYQLLVQKYSESQAEIRYNIVLVLKHWVKTPHVVVDMEVLQQMINFARSIATGQIAVSARQVVEGIDARTSAPPRNWQTLGADQCPSPSPEKIKPKDLAIALTTLEGEKYGSLFPADYIRHLLQPSSSSNIQAATDINNQIFTWVKMSVLIPDKYDLRAEVIKFFINTALECRKLGNFASVVAIVTALQSASITRLTVTMEEVQADGRKSLATLSELISDVPVHRAYQIALEKSKNSCVPWIAVHILELSAVLRKHDEVVIVDGRPLINFQRSIEIAKWVKKMLKYKEPNIDRARYAESLAYLERQLSKVMIGASTDDALENQSNIFAQAEADIHRYRIREFRSLGLATSRR